MFLYFSLYFISAQLAKTALLTSTLMPLGYFQIFKVWSDAKERGVGKATGSYRTYSVPGKTAVWVSELAVEDLPSAELQPMFRRLQ